MSDKTKLDPLLQRLAEKMEERGLRPYIRSCDNCVSFNSCKNKRSNHYCQDHELDEKNKYGRGI